jgi:hypothetical protein
MTQPHACQRHCPLYSAVGRLGERASEARQTLLVATQNHSIRSLPRGPTQCFQQNCFESMRLCRASKRRHPQTVNTTDDILSPSRPSSQRWTYSKIWTATLSPFAPLTSWSSRDRVVAPAARKSERGWKVDKFRGCSSF